MFWATYSRAQSLDCLDDQTLHALAEREKSCQKTELNFDTVNQAYQEHLKEIHTGEQFWQTPVFLVGGFAFSFGVGALFVGTKCFGLCR